MLINLPLHDYELCRHFGAGELNLNRVFQPAGSDPGGGLVVRSGFCSERGGRAANEDFAAFADRGHPGCGIVAAIADGVGGAKGGRVAAELTVRGFIDGCLGQARHVLPKESSIRSLAAVNRWVHSISRRDPNLQGMACTFTALICSARQIHIVHVGDTRLYRLRGDRLQRLTDDHTLGPGNLNRLARAVGTEEELRIDYHNLPNEPHDRYLLCSDGVHGGVSDAALREILLGRAAPDETARDIVARALAARIGDNATALIIDVIDLPSAPFSDLEDSISGKSISASPVAGAVVDNFRIESRISDGRYVEVFRATDLNDGRQIVLKFPKPLEGADRPMREAFLREMWIASRVRSPYVGEVLQLSSDRQTRLYLAMPFYEGEMLESRLKRRPMLSLTAGLDIALKASRGLAAMHRAGVIHRDIKPDNIILCPPMAGQPSIVKIIDFGVARQMTTRDIGAVSEPGTPSYMAPELFDGRQADQQTDLFALGVTVYRLFTNRFPYGEIEPFSHPKFRTAIPLTQLRPDLPAWLDRTIARAIAVNPADRYADVIEFVFEMEHGAERASPIILVRKPLYARNPLMFWKAVSALLVVLLAFMLFTTIGHRQPPRPGADPTALAPPRH